MYGVPGFIWARQRLVKTSRFLHVRFGSLADRAVTTILSYHLGHVWPPKSLSTHFYGPGLPKVATVVMNLLQYKGHCILGNYWLTAEEKKFSGRKRLQGKVNMAAAGSGTEAPQRRIALLSGDEVLQP